MKLYILRHGVAADRNPKEYPDDSLRPLTKAGQKKLEKVAHFLIKTEVHLDYVFSGPFLRAFQTANLVCKSLNMEKDRLVLTDQLAPLGDFEQLVVELQATAPTDTLLLVGHEPELSELISWFLTGDRTLAIDLKKGGLCCLNIDQLEPGRCATLDWLLTPAQLSLLK